ncbi:hypothetical protein [Thalassoglobus neptunius]|nr:hypothetical protein [Thalassoglobus neptunius]
MDDQLNFRCLSEEKKLWAKAARVAAAEAGSRKVVLSDWIRETLNLAAEAQLDTGQKKKPKS